MAKAKYALLVRDNDSEEWRVHRNRLIYYLHDLANDYKTYTEKYPNKHVMAVELFQVSSSHIESGYKRYKAMKEHKNGPTKGEEDEQRN